jgi:hypothetical protein
LEFIRQPVFPALLCRIGDEQEALLDPAGYEISGGALGQGEQLRNVVASDDIALLKEFERFPLSRVELAQQGRTVDYARSRRFVSAPTDVFEAIRCAFAEILNPVGWDRATTTRRP